MHIFKLKEGSKSFEWVKDVIDKERKQSAEYCGRIRKAVPFQLPITMIFVKKLGLRAIVSCIPFRPTNLFTHDGKYYFVLTDDLVIKDNDNNDDLELITEEDAKRLIGFKDERVYYSK